MKSSLFALALCAGMLSNLVAADMATPPKSTKWLTHDQEQALTDSVPPYPATDDADLAKSLAIQASRTDAMIAECKLDQKYAYTLFNSVYGKELTPTTSPKFCEMLKDVNDITYVVNEGAKNKYKRLRPYQGHPGKVHALFDVKGFSYPSGHSMGSYTMAIVLGAIFPDKAQAFLDRAGQIAQSRVDAGVHYPSDIAEGEVLGKATGAAILANADFQKDLAAVQAELKK